MKNSCRNWWWIYLIGALFGASGLVVAYIVYLILTTPQPSNTALLPDVQSDGITEIEPPLPMPDFTLTDQHGNLISLSDLRGQPVMITFGFTHCPDICPLTLGEMRGIHEALGDRANDVHFVFISVDGERDTPHVLLEYLRLLRLDSLIVGMTGVPDVVRDVSADYGVEFIYNVPDSEGNYSVDHTAGMFLLDAEGQWIRRYRYGTPREKIVADLQTILSVD